MAIARDFPLPAHGRRGKGPRTKAKARVARARRAAEQFDVPVPTPLRRQDKTGTLASAHTIGLGTVYRPGHLHDPRSGRRV